MIFKFFTLISAVLFSSLAHAQSGYCNSSAVRKIQRPIYSQAPDKGSFEYRYSFSERDDQDATVVIFVPGGPGQTSMDMPLAYPGEFAVVRTDPRGVGCNAADSTLPSASLSSEQIARDVLAVVKDLKPKKYILHGISYGTVVATMAAALAEQEGVPQPAAVVLEGTMAKVYKPNEYLAGYLENWKTLKKSLPSSVARQFLGPQFPLGFTSQQWAAWVSALLIYGEVPAGNYALNMMSYLGPDAPEYGPSILQAQLKNIAKPPTADKTRVYREIICRELVPDIRDVKYDFDFVNGDLVGTSARLCAETSLSRPYDSARYQIQAPVFYFSGDQDPATPSAQVRYHFRNQYTAQRTWVSVASGGHQALSGNLMDCSENIWRAIEKNSASKVNESLQACALREQIKIQEVSASPTAAAKKTAVLFERMKRLYEKEATRVGGELTLDINWAGRYPVAKAERNVETDFKVELDGGILTWERSTPDTVAMTLCHEVGHLMGGEELRNAPPEWDGPTAPNGRSLLSAEGQADYYATAVCFRRLVQGEDHRAVLQTRVVPENVVQQCDQTWGLKSNNSALCQRTALASLDFLNMVKEFQISFASPDRTKVNETIRNEYPPRQCRLDTLVAGALCKANLPLNFNLQDRVVQSACAQGPGARPACWYKNP